MSSEIFCNMHRIPVDCAAVLCDTAGGRTPPVVHSARCTHAQCKLCHHNNNATVVLEVSSPTHTDSAVSVPLCRMYCIPQMPIQVDGCFNDTMTLRTASLLLCLALCVRFQVLL